MPKGVRLKPEQIVAKLREIEVKIGQGKDVLSAFFEIDGEMSKQACLTGHQGGHTLSPE